MQVAAAIHFLIIRHGGKMRYTRIIPFLSLLLLIAFAGCSNDDMSSINSPVSDNTSQALSKSNGNHNDDFEGDFDNDHKGHSRNVHAVYTLSNSAAGNEVIMYRRSGRGNLSYAGSYSTGGTGTGAGLGSQGALVLYDGFIFAVNAGSNEVSVLSVGRNGLSLVDKKPSGGEQPISVTVHRNLLYVLNAGGSGNITGFKIHHDGSLSQISGSTKPLSSSASGPAQIEFNPNGRVLIVTEKATNSILSYSVGHDGIANGPNVQASAGDTPFGFEFDRRGRLIVSDAYGGNSLAGAMSSYNVSAGGVNLISGPVYNTQTAPCWVAITNNGRFAYTTNTGTSNISGYWIKHDGTLKLFNDGGNAASTGAGSSPIDMAISNNSQYLYALSAGTNTISVFRIDNRRGGLKSIQTVSGLSSGTVGLAAN